MTPNLKSATIWGSLPGTTDETIFVVAHRDGWFEGANDNAAGVASMIGLAGTSRKFHRRSAAGRSPSWARPDITTRARRAVLAGATS
jgi:hypothetical protein